MVEIFTEPDIDDKSGSVENRTLYVAALNNIFTAMKGLRIFDRFGFYLPKLNAIERPKMKITNNYNVWLFESKSHDWINVNDYTGLSS